MPKNHSLPFPRREDHEKEFREGFNAFDWNHSGKISYGNLKVIKGRVRHYHHVSRSLPGCHEAVRPQPDRH